MLTLPEVKLVPLYYKDGGLKKPDLEKKKKKKKKKKRKIMEPDIKQHFEARFILTAFLPQRQNAAIFPSAMISDLSQRFATSGSTTHVQRKMRK